MKDDKREPTIEIDLDELDAALGELDERIEELGDKFISGLSAARKLLAVIREDLET